MTFKKENYEKSFISNGKEYSCYDIQAYAQEKGKNIQELPYSVRILLEQAMRQYDGVNVTAEHIEAILNWEETQEKAEYPFKPMRVVLQDFTGVPAIVDLASMREAVDQLDGDASVINPDIAVDLVVDHSVQVDSFGSAQSPIINRQKEFDRNQERYEFIKWAQTAFDNFTAVPADTGIVHQVNIEYLADVIMTRQANDKVFAFPDTCFGTDSHTPMVNGLGVLGWGVGGIEAEAAMLGQFTYSPLPEVVGVKLTGNLQETINATDLVLAVTKLLRDNHVVGSFVEYYGPGYEALTVSDRATISNMAPEYGATVGYFPIDQETLKYLDLTNRDSDKIDFIKDYAQANHLWYDGQADVHYSRVLELNLDEVKKVVAGPKRPQDKINIEDLDQAFAHSLTYEEGNHGFGLDEKDLDKEVQLTFEGEEISLTHGSLFIAAITSCTNTSNPNVMMAAGLLAKNAVEKGLEVPVYVKTSLAPGSKTVTEYYERSGLQPYLDKLGFNIVGYGCTTCIGNSGPLHPDLVEVIQENDLISAAVLSGNRNFEGRINPNTFANYIAAPPLVIAYALAGRIDIDLTSQPLGHDQDNRPVYLRDIWPSDDLIHDYVSKYVSQDIYDSVYKNLYNENPLWQEMAVSDNPVYEWDDQSTYVQNPPYFEDMSLETEGLEDLSGLRVLAKFGDSVTTDHISPAGVIPASTPAGQYLLSQDVAPKDFNTYGARRGNHEVMVRGTLANIRIRNQIAEGKTGGFTKYWPSGEIMSMYDAAMRYKEDDTGLVILAGDDYGMGSSRDWAAKGVKLLNVKAVIAKSFERIHRANLVMMGLLPLEFMPGEDADVLGLTGEETFDIPVTPETGIHEIIEVTASRPGFEKRFNVLVRFDSYTDIDYYHHGGILPYVLRDKAVANA